MTFSATASLTVAKTSLFYNPHLESHTKENSNRFGNLEGAPTPLPYSLGKPPLVYKIRTLKDHRPHLE